MEPRQAKNHENDTLKLENRTLKPYIILELVNRPLTKPLTDSRSFTIRKPKTGFSFSEPPGEDWLIKNINPSADKSAGLPILNNVNFDDSQLRGCTGFDGETEV